MDRSYISKLERGKQQPTLLTILELASALNVPASKIILEMESIFSLNEITFNKNNLELVTCEKLCELFSWNSMHDKAPNTSEQPTILLVEDEIYLRDFLCGLLKSQGFNVITAEDGHIAVEIYKNKMDCIDFILMDIMMPKKDGVVAHNEIKKINPAVKILLMSGYSAIVLGEIANHNFIQTNAA